MEKAGKRILALILAVVMVLGSNGIVMAAESTDGIPIVEDQDLNNPDAGNQDAEAQNGESSNDEQSIPEDQEAGYGPLWEDNNFYANGIPVQICSIPGATEADGALISWEAGNFEGTDIAWEAGTAQVGPETTVYGGSTSGEYDRTIVVMNGGTVNAIYGAGVNDTVDETWVQLNGGTVSGNVFGGGIYSVVGDTYVEVTASGKYDEAGNAVIGQNESGETVQLPSFDAEGIYLGNAGSDSVTGEADVVVKNGSNPSNGQFSANLNIAVKYEKTEMANGVETVVQTGSIAESAKAVLIFDEYNGSFMGTVSGDVDEITVSNTTDLENTEITLPEESREDLESKVAVDVIGFEGEVSKDISEDETQQPEEDTEESGTETIKTAEDVVGDGTFENPEYDDNGIMMALSEEEFLAPLADTADGHSHVGERLYAVDLYASENTDVAYVVAHFFENKPEFVGDSNEATDATGGAELQQYMTRTDAYYGVRIPELDSANNKYYNYVTFEVHRTDDTILAHKRIYQFNGYTGEDTYTADLVQFEFEAKTNDAIYTGQQSRSYINAHPTDRNNSLTNEVLFFNFNNMPDRIGEAEPYVDVETGTEYFLLTWTDASGNEKTAKITSKSLHDEKIWYYIFTSTDKVSEDTIFTLSAKNSGSNSIRFTYPRVVEERNMLMIGGLLSNSGAWGTYSAQRDENGNMTVSMNDFLTEFGNGNIQIQYTTEATVDNDTSWKNATVEDAVEEFPNVHGAQDVPGNATYIRIRGGNNYSGRWETEALSTSDSDFLRWDYPCFFAYKGSDGELLGSWNNVYASLNTGDDAQNIEEGTYVRNNNAYYGTVDLYDYYSTFEMQGNAFVKKNADGSYTTKSYADYPYAGSTFNTVLKDYYEKSNSIDADNANEVIYFGGSTQSLDGAGLSGSDNQYKNNNVWQNDNYVTRNLVDNTLSASDGYALTMSGETAPFFNKDFIRGENSLNTAVGQVYSNVIFPFEKSSDGYWEYNSANDSVVLKEDPNQGYYLEDRANGQEVLNPGSSTKGFFPFDTYVEGYTNGTTSADGDGTDTSPTSRIRQRRNCLFGAAMSIPFSVTDNGNITTSSGTTPITFEFSGDDDVWIYIDGHLVLDLGGAHGTLGGTINFATGDVTYSGSYNIYNNGGKEGEATNNAGSMNNITMDNGQTLTKYLQDGENHTLTMYYLERGQYASNMRIKFNFPVQSKFTVSNTINTDGGDPIFDDVLENMGGFNYRLYNQAVSGPSTSVDQAEGYTRAGVNILINSGTDASTVSKVQENGSVTEIGASQSPDGSTDRAAIKYTVEGTVGSWDADNVDARLIEIQTDNTQISSYEYLRMDVWSENASTLGYDMYIRVNGTNRNGNGSYVSEGPVSDYIYNGNNNTLQAGNWNTVRIDLSKVKNTGMSIITSIEIGYRVGGTLYIDDIRLFAAMQTSASNGFSVAQDKISDYGSITSGALEAAAEADYRLYNGLDTEATETNGIIGAVTDQGTFTLGDQQKVVFTDKFRAGSYIHLHEAIIDGDGKVFKSAYSVSEGGNDNTYTTIPKAYLIPNRDDATTVQNETTGVPIDLANIAGRTADDSRTSIISSGSSYQSVEAGYGKINANRLEGEKDTSLVYRNYENPDMVEGAGIDIRVDYVNTLRFGSVTIEKVINYDPNADYAIDGMTAQQFAEAMDGDSFRFRIYFTNIANRWLENYSGEEIYKDIDVTIHAEQTADGTYTGKLSGTAAMSGIPAGTEYKIYEIETVGIELVNIEVGASTVAAGGNAHENTGVQEPVKNETTGETEALGYAYGKAYESDQAFTFTNDVPDTDGLTVRKIWNNMTDDEAAGQMVNVVVKRRTVDGTQGWEIATNNAGKELTGSITGNSTLTFDNVPSFAIENEDGNKVVHRYQYRVEEASGTDGYVPIYGITDDGVYTITNTAEGQAFYVWKDHQTVLPITNLGISPESYDITFRQGSDYETGSEAGDGVFTVSNNGTVSINSPANGSETYIMRLTPKMGVGGETRDVTLTIYTYDVNSDIYVLDYGLPAKLADHNYPGTLDSAANTLKDGIFADDYYSARSGSDETEEFVGFAKKTGEQYGVNVYGAYTDNTIPGTEDDGTVHNGRLEITRQTDTRGHEGVDVIFTPTKLMDQIDEYSYKTIIRAPGSESVEEAAITAVNGVVMTEDVKIMPASVVYYDDSFGYTKDGSGNVINDGSVSGIVYNGTYPVTITDGIYQSIDADEAYGHDDAYNDAAGSSPGQTDGLNGNTELFTSADYKQRGTAEFTFTGTGFDIVGRTDNQSVIIRYMIYDADNKLIKYGMVDTFYEGTVDEGLYQIPVISVHDLAASTYRVSLATMYRSVDGNGTAGVFRMDGIRIYNPLGSNTQYYNEAEKGAVTYAIRDMILGGATLNDQGTLKEGTQLDGATAAIVYSDGSTAAQTYALGSTVTEVPGVGTSAVSTSSLNDFLVSGPKGEIYLRQGSAIAFYAADNNPGSTDKTLQVEAKAVNTKQDGSDYPVLVNVKEKAEGTEAAGSKIAIDSSTAMYYKIDTTGCYSPAQNTYLVILANNSDSDISLSNIKAKGYTLSYPTSGIKKMEQADVNENTQTAIAGGYEVYKTSVTGNGVSAADDVKVVSAAFATPFVKKGGSNYLNVTLKMKEAKYHPLVLEYTDGSLQTASVDEETLKSIRYYTAEETETVTGEDGAETTQTVEYIYCIFKVKVDFDVNVYTDGQQCTFLVAAEDNRSTTKEISNDYKIVSTIVQSGNFNPSVQSSTNEPTNQAVMMTLSADEAIQPIEGWTQVDAQTYTRAYSENGKYTVSVENMGGYKEAVSFAIANIDTEAPIATVALDNTEKNHATATLNVNEQIQGAEGWTKVDEYTYTREYTQNGSDSVTVSDLAGNETSVTFEITKIGTEDKETTNPGNSQNNSGNDEKGVVEKVVSAVSGFFTKMFSKVSKWF